MQCAAASTAPETPPAPLKPAIAARSKRSSEVLLDLSADKAADSVPEDQDLNALRAKCARLEQRLQNTKDILDTQLREANFKLRNRDVECAQLAAKLKEAGVRSLFALEIISRHAYMLETQSERWQYALRRLWKERICISCCVCHEEHGAHLCHPSAPGQSEHVICSDCLDRMTRTSVRGTAGGNAAPLKCPLCRVPFDLRYNHAKDRLYEAFEPNLEPVSDLPERPRTGEEAHDRINTMFQKHDHIARPHVLAIQRVCAQQNMGFLAVPDVAYVRQLLYPTEGISAAAAVAPIPAPPLSPSHPSPEIEAFADDLDL